MTVCADSVKEYIETAENNIKILENVYSYLDKNTTVQKNSDGAMLTDSWCKDLQGWYYVGKNGCAETDYWKKDSIGWIWLNFESSMTKSQWLKYKNDCMG